MRRDQDVTAMSYALLMAERHLGKHFLRQWREYRGLSLRKFADRLEIEPGVQLMSHANIGRIETFEQPYSQELLEAAAIALECSVTDLLTVDPTKERKVVDLVRLLQGMTEAEQEDALKAIRFSLELSRRG